MFKNILLILLFSFILLTGCSSGVSKCKMAAGFSCDISVTEKDYSFNIENNLGKEIIISSFVIKSAPECTYAGSELKIENDQSINFNINCPNEIVKGTKINCAYYFTDSGPKFSHDLEGELE